MSNFYESDSSHQFGRDSGDEDSVASSHAPQQEAREKRPRAKQVIGNAWVLRGEITINMIHNNSDQADMHGDVENDAKVQTTKSQIQAALGAKFESLFVKMLNNIKYFVFFCNLVDILHVGPAATKVKIQIRGFLQIGKATTLTALEKLLSPSFSPVVSAFLSAKWERCPGGLCGNEEYEDCLHEKSPWMPIQSTGQFRENNRGRIQTKRLVI